MNLCEILSAHQGDERKTLIVILLAYANISVKSLATGCNGKSKLGKHHAEIIVEYRSALNSSPWEVPICLLDEVQNDPYFYLLI